ncbi:ATP-binding protein [Actinomadura rupiterrae]|uniref:ATP-binding protein n=1 Tax=Actinomadura rupiterrae TaxID=559627 RepID=UPI0020A3145E|nr:ATP-binding protein [Actinomadura rupiterrae]MCP2336202.1 anti-sigma regulatory factor (Ser/Thr protein kinase) [Actinomadura rupiterrae]
MSDCSDVVARQVFASDERQVAAARRWVAKVIGDGHPVVDDCVLLTSETFTNAVVHGGGEQVEVSVEPDVRGVTVAVVDGGGGALPHYVDDPCGVGGRGLPILRALAAEWGFRVLEDGRLRVWFYLASE